MTTSTRFDVFEFVEERSRLIADALEFVEQTRKADAEYGREENSRTRRLEGIEQALQETDLKIVVIGEFSRGKSTLLNALLGDQILPTANNQTTAINTFIYGVEDGREPYIEILYQDGRREELEWSQGVIERWGTELNEENRDARKEVEKIHVYSEHPLLQNDLVLIDTPGFEGILPRHEEIAKSAMNDAHVALWLQSASQLGGNIREWQFLQDSLAKNFHKFLTVINKWDLVLEPQDPNEQEKPEEQRTEEALQEVRENFYKYCGDDLESGQLETLTDENNLMGVSAIWGLSDDPEKAQASNVEMLATRIERMCKTGEAEKQILAGPLQGLQDIQQDLVSTIEEERTTIEESDDLEELKQRADKLSHELDRLELESERRIEDARIEHQGYAAEYQERVRSELVEPLDLLEDAIDEYIEEERILEKLKNGRESVGLPDEVQQKFEMKLDEINQRWEEIREDLQRDLEQLASDFEDQMGEVAANITERIGKGKLDLDPLAIDLAVDLSSFEAHQRKRSKIKARLDEQREELKSTRDQKNTAELERLEARKSQAQRELKRQQRRLDNLGSPPEPRKKTVAKKKPRGGIIGTAVDKLFGEKQVQEVEYDWSEVRRYRERERELEETLQSKQERIQEIIDEYHEQKGVQLSAEQAENRFEREIDKLQRRLDQARENYEKEMKQEAERLSHTLYEQTLQQLSDQKQQLQNDVPEDIRQLFERHLSQLEDAVEEQYREPMETKRNMLQDTRQLKQEKEEKIQTKQRELESLSNKVEKLHENTDALLDEIHRVYAD